MEFKRVCFMERVEQVLKQKKLTQKELARTGKKTELFRLETSAIRLQSFLMFLRNGL